MIAKLDKNNHKIDKMERRIVENTISPITINPIGTGGPMGTISKSKKIKRSDSNNKVIM